MHLRCPHCHNPVDLLPEQPLHDVSCPSCGSSFNLISGDTTRGAIGSPRTLGRFQLLDELGVGHFGSVWKARDPELDRLVAVKIPRREGLDPQETELFLREARAAAQLRHPNIVSVHEVGRDAETVYIVSDFIDGCNLKEWLTGQKLTPREAAELCATIAEALHTAHESGVVHRDLKPGNILMDISGQPHIADFGLAKRESGEITMTVQGQLLGTPAYMSPEQARGEGHHADRRSDVYSLGVILFELLTSELPFRGDKRMLLVQIQRDEPPSPRKFNSHIPRDLETICLKCLEKDPGKRYPTAAEFAADLRRHLGGEPILARPIGGVARVWRWCQRNPSVAALSATIAVLLTAVTLASTFIAILQRQATRQEKQNVAHQEERTKTVEGLHEKALSAQKFAEQEQQRAKGLAEEKEQQVAFISLVAGSLVSNNDQGDLPEALLWFSEALRIRQADPHKEHADRLRIGALLRTIPRLQQLWFGTALNTWAEFSPDDRFVAASAFDGTVRIWSVADGKELQTIRAHARPALCVRFSPDSQRLITTSADNTARLWRVTDGQPIGKPLQHESVVTYAEFDPMGQFVVTASDDHSAQLWNASTGEPHGERMRHQGDVTTARFSPDGQRVVTGSRDGLARLWDVVSIKPLRDFDHVRNAVDHLAFAPDGKRIVTVAGPQCRFRIWDIEKGSVLVGPIEHDGGSIISVAFSPDGTRIATAGLTQTARVWNASTGAPVTPYLKHEGIIWTTSFSPDGRWLLTASDDRTVRLWDAATGQYVVPPMRHSGWIKRASFSSNGLQVVSASSDRTVQVWDVVPASSLALVCEHPNLVETSDFSPDGRRIVTSCRDGNARVWDAATSRELFKLPHKGAVLYAAYSGDGQKIVTCSYDDTARVWSADTGEPITPGLRHGHTVWHAAFSPDGKLVVTASEDGTARLWDAVTGEPKSDPLKHKRKVVHVAFSPQGEWLATASEDQTARLWDVRTGKATTPPLQHDERVVHVTFSPDGQLLASSSYDKTARLWSVPDGKPIGEPIIHGSWVYAAQFTPDGHRLVTAGGDEAGWIWDLKTHTLAASPLRHRDWVFWVSLSKDGRQVATVSRDNTARVWETDTGRWLSLPFKHPALVRRCQFSPDGRRLATVSGDQYLRLWELSAETRPAEEVALLAQLISGHRSDPALGLIPLDTASLRTIRDRLQGEASSAAEANGSVNASTLADQAQQFARDGVWAVAAGLWSRALERQTDHADWWMARAQARVHLKQWSAALSDCDRAAALGGDAVALARLRAFAAASLHRWEEAAQAITQSLAAAPEDAQLHLFKSLIAAARGQTDDAEADYQAAVARTDVIRLRRAAFWEHWLDSVPKSDRALSQVLLSLAAEVTRQAPTESLGWRCRGLAHALERDWQSAHSDFTKATEMRAEDWEAWCGRARSRVQLRLSAESLSEFDRCLELNDQSWSLWFMRGTVREKLNQTAGAAEDFRNTLDRGNNDWQTWAAQGLMQSRLNRWDDAFESYAKASTLEPTQSFLWRNRAVTQRQRGNLAESYDDYTQALRVDPSDVFALQHRCSILCELNRWDEAATDLERVLDKRGADLTVWEHSATVEVARKNLTKYRELCQKMRERFGDRLTGDFANGVVWICSFQPQVVEDYSPLVQMTRNLIRDNPKNPAYLNTLGAVLYRDGKFDEAAKVLQQVLTEHPQESGPFDCCFLAMTAAQLGNEADAKKWLDAMNSRAEEPAFRATLANSWSHRVQFNAFQEEAIALIREKFPDK